MNFLGLIVKCRNGKFVKVEKEGLFEGLDSKITDGFAGREITQLGEPKSNYLVWDKKGCNTRSTDWDLMETRADQDPRIIEKEWPNGK